MKTFKSFLVEAEAVVGVKAGHMTHLEDLVFDLGVEGTRKAINFMRDVRDMLSQGTGGKKAVATVKFDGAPALIAGINPENGKFFVAKKGIFNKNPKLYYSHADIDADTQGDLANKLKVAFTECKKLGLTSGVYQGDIMFTSDSLKNEKIDGDDYVTFHPNTIVYAVKKDSALGRQIRKANIGIVWHTTFEGDTIAALKPTFGKSIVDKFAKKSSSWMEDATFKDVTGVATFTDAERKAFDSKLSEIGTMFQRMPATVVNAIHKDETLLTLVHTYNNSKIRAGERVTDIPAHVSGLYDFIFERYEKEKKGLKTAAAKTRKDEERKKVLNFFALHPKSEIIKVFELASAIATAKQMLVDKMNKASNVGTFLKTKDGFRVTGAEGFVAISEQGAVKLVDRLEFSLANFSPLVLKGWQR
jgi:hypothetical protein